MPATTHANPLPRPLTRLTPVGAMALLTALGLAASAHRARGADSAIPSIDQLAAWGAETLQTIDRDFLVADRGYYAEALDLQPRRRGPGRRGRPPAFMWSAGVHLSALSAAAAVDPDRYAATLAARIESLEPYWHEHQGVSGYDVLPNPTKPDRYYDDNAWIALALLEAHELNGDPAHLARVREILAFMLSGEDDRLGGGVYWRENEKTSKNTCINAPAALSALILHQRTGEAEHLAIGRRLYDWTRAKLQDPDDGLYWDNMNLQGRIDRRKFTYNSAVMLRAAVRLYAITGEQSHLVEASRIGQSARDHWINPETGGVRDGGQFAHMLLEALLELAAAKDDAELRNLVLRSAAHVRHDLRDDQGRYAHNWDAPPQQPPRRIKLLDQSSAARLFFAAARALRAVGPAAPPAADEASRQIPPSAAETQRSR